MLLKHLTSYLLPLYYDRYLKVVPSTTQDDRLLAQTVNVLSTLLTHQANAPDQLVAWIARTVIYTDSPIMVLLKALPTTEVVTDQITESKR